MSTALGSAEAARRLWFRRDPGLVWEPDIGPGLVFDPASGETHFLSELPALILSTIDDSPATYAELVERFAGPVDLHHQATAQIIAALISLEGAELIESQAP